MLLPKYTVEFLGDNDMQWFVETAAVNMLKNEVKMPEYINADNLYALASMGALTNTAFVAKADGKCVGALGGIIIPNMFNPKINMLSEIFWYVEPEYRGTRAGSMLLNAYLKRAEEIDVFEISVSLLSSSEINIKSLEKKGFIMAEYGFRKVL